VSSGREEYKALIVEYEGELMKSGSALEEFRAPAKLKLAALRTAPAWPQSQREPL
jgi:hypothetical protein